MVSKTKRFRHIALTPQAVKFLEHHVADRDGDEHMFRRLDGSQWGRNDQGRRVDAACRAGRINPPIGFHGLRHTWASLAVMKGMPLMVVAKNLGHTSTAMVEKHYGHLTQSYVVEAIKKYSPQLALPSP